jgi:hypothetical protein
MVDEFLQLEKSAVEILCKHLKQGADLFKNVASLVVGSAAFTGIVYFVRGCVSSPPI